MKKLLSLILAVCMLMSAVYAFPVNTAAAATSGTCGTNLTWKYDSSTYTLTISGTGAMSGYSNSLYNGIPVTSAPWRPYYNTMKTVIIGDGVTSIGDFAFYDCTSLTSVTIPDSVTSIGDYAFESCTSLASVTIPDSVTIIGDGAFRVCTSLTSVTIGTSVTSIGEYAFLLCESLTSITVSDKNTAYSSQDGVLFNKDKTELIQYPIGNTRTEYTIPDSVTSIGEYAFSSCTSLTSVTIPDSVTSIGEGAFFDCTSLTSVTIGNSVTSIGEGAFYGCTRLTDVYYKGTREQWNSISIGSGNDTLKNAHLHIWCEKYGHIFDEITETIPATCTEEGYETGHCTICQELATNPLPLHSATINRMEIPATCTRDGMFTEVCTECGTTVSAGTIPAKGHTSATETVDSTCTVDGYSKVYCSVCNEVLSNTVIPASHKTKTETVPATCTEDGKTTVSCTVCFETLSETVIPKLGHSWNSGVITVAATCTEDGVRTYSCTRTGCTETRTEAIEKLGHNYKSTVTAPTCTADGYTTHTCSRCTDTYTDNIVAKLGHEPKRTEVPATCTESGMYFEQCSRCNTFLGSGVIPATGRHTFVNGKCINCTATVPVGDLDGDGEIGGTDVILYRRYFSRRLEELPHPGNADYNADGKVNAKDLLGIRKFLAA